MAVKRAFNVLAAQIGICVVLTVFGINHLFADIKVPNEFSSGSPAKASEVNENFAALVEDIQAITEPEKKYSIISSETLDSGLVRTKLYAFETISYQILFAIPLISKDLSWFQYLLLLVNFLNKLFYLIIVWQLELAKKHFLNQRY